MYNISNDQRGVIPPDFGVSNGGDSDTGRLGNFLGLDGVGEGTFLGSDQLFFFSVQSNITLFHSTMKVTVPVAAASALTVGLTVVLLAAAYRRFVLKKRGRKNRRGDPDDGSDEPNNDGSSKSLLHSRLKSYWDNRLDEEKLRIRRARILAKQIIVTRPQIVRVAESSDSISSLDESNSLQMSSSDEREGGYVTKNLKLYHYYDVEIKGRESEAKAYEKNLYRGYSSYNPSPYADAPLFKQAEINVKRLGDWNRRYSREKHYFILFSLRNRI
jgi:hypothetical protein